MTWGGITIGATPPAAMSGVVDVAIGLTFAVALKSDGTLVAWGLGEHGQQNIPAAASSRRPASSKASTSP